tara:strand:- start:2651 stop:3166 length:516 start_codon:yes stop_codon:yes gene_type:complete
MAISEFDAPVPGQSLTGEPKGWAWERPPRFVKVEDAAMFVWDKLHEQEQLERMIILLDVGVSVDSLTKTIVFGGFVEGAYTPDVAALLFPIVQRMIFSIGKKAEVKNIKLSNAKVDNTKKLVGDLLKSRNVNEDRLEVFEKDKEQREEKLEEIQKGLMSPNREIIEEEDED